MKLPLEDIRVLELAQAWATPHGCSILASLGAEVIKVESLTADSLRGIRRPSPVSGTYPHGDPGETPWNRAGVFNQINLNKMAISLDFDSKEGQDIFKDLVKKSDVVVEGYIPGAAVKRGLTYEELKKVKPDIIMTSVWGYGQTGPWNKYHAFGVCIEPTAGWFSLTGYTDDESPRRSGVDHVDPQVGAHLAGAVLAALLYRRKTGKGQYIDASFLESAVAFLGPQILDYSAHDRLPGHIGNSHPVMCPHGCYQCKGDDQWVTIAVRTDEDWESFCKATGNIAWLDDDRFSDLASRQKHREELGDLIERWTIGRDKYDVMHTLQEAGVAAGAVLDVAEVFGNPQVRAAGIFETVEHPEAGTFEYICNRVKLENVTFQVRPAPCYGEHNDYVYGKLLGMSRERIDELLRKGIIANEPLIGWEDHRLERT